jgi:hypothetical protein
MKSSNGRESKDAGLGLQVMLEIGCVFWSETRDVCVLERGSAVETHKFTPAFGQLNSMKPLESIAQPTCSAKGLKGCH